MIYHNLTECQLFSFKGALIKSPNAENMLSDKYNWSELMAHQKLEMDQIHNFGSSLINIFGGQIKPRPIKVRITEHHPLGSQAFIPLKHTPFVVANAPNIKNFMARNIQVFSVNSNQGVNYKCDFWLHPFLTLENKHQSIVINRGGPRKTQGYPT